MLNKVWVKLLGFEEKVVEGIGMMIKSCGWNFYGFGSFDFILKKFRLELDNID